METLLLSLLVFLTAVSAMAVGTLLGNRTINGSCGGLNHAPGETCAACTRRCERKRTSDCSSPRHATRGKDFVT